MTKQVNIYTSNWRATGKTISVPQYSVDVALKVQKDDGSWVDYSETLKFPNFLQKVGAADLKEWLTDLMLHEARERLVGE